MYIHAHTQTHAEPMLGRVGWGGSFTEKVREAEKGREQRRAQQREVARDIGLGRAAVVEYFERQRHLRAQVGVLHGVCVCVCVCARALASMRAAAWKYVVSLNHSSKGCRHARRHASASMRVCRHSCARACIHTFMHSQRHATMQAVRSLLQPRHTHSRAAGRSEGRAHAGRAQRCTSVRK